MPSRSSFESKSEWAISFVLPPPRSSSVSVSTETWPGMPSHSKVQTIRSGGTISRYSPRKPCSSTPSGPLCRKRYLPPGRKSISHFASEYFRGPHHLSRCSHFVCASKTSSRGALNSRVISDLPVRRERERDFADLLLLHWGVPPPSISFSLFAPPVRPSPRRGSLH